jgi:hypothetical protein
VHDIVPAGSKIPRQLDLKRVATEVVDVQPHADVNESTWPRMRRVANFNADRTFTVTAVVPGLVVEPP